MVYSCILHLIYWSTQWLWPIDRDRYPSLTVQPWASPRRRALWVPRLTAPRFRWNPANRDFDQQNIRIGWDLVEFNVIWKGSHWEISPEKCGIGRSSHRLVELESTHQKMWISWLLGLNDHCEKCINSTDNVSNSELVNSHFQRSSRKTMFSGKDEFDWRATVARPLNFQQNAVFSGKHLSCRRPSAYA